MSETFDVAQICENGHVITSMVKSHPELAKKFCDSCGEKTISTCRNAQCGAPIKGFGNTWSGYKKPFFCDNCGTPYPWTSRAQEAASELIDTVDNLSDEDKASFKKSVNDLTKNSASTSVAAIKYKKIIAKADPQVGSAMKDVLANVVSETVKRAIWDNK